jgi:hypothetical protein
LKKERSSRIKELVGVNLAELRPADDTGVAFGTENMVEGRY